MSEEVTERLINMWCFFFFSEVNVRSKKKSPDDTFCM